MKLKKDREIVLAAVKNGGHALNYASDELKNDREIVLAAVTNNDDYSDEGHMALEFASDQLKKIARFRARGGGKQWLFTASYALRFFFTFILHAVAFRPPAWVRALASTACAASVTHRARLPAQTGRL